MLSTPSATGSGHGNAIEHLHGGYQLRLDEWGKRTPLTQIVAIGAQINPLELNEKFDACIEQS